MLRLNKLFMDEADGNGNDLSGGEGQGEAPQWYYNAPTEDNPGIGGQGEAPEWFKVDKYKSVEEQAKGYSELAKRFGGFESAPEEYEMPEGIEPESFDAGLMDIVKGIGKEHQMGQGMFNQLISQVAEYETAKAEEAKAQAMEQLGENAEARINDIAGWLNVNAPKEVVEAVTNLAISAEAVEAIEFFIGKSKGSKVADANAQQPQKISQSEYAEMLMATDSHGNLKMATDAEYKQKMDELTLKMQS